MQAATAAIPSGPSPRASARIVIETMSLAEATEAIITAIIEIKVFIR
jgi:hypothetical protein